METRDVPAIVAALRPGHVLIHHYDAACSASRYRIAQVVWLQCELDRRGLPARVLPPSAAGLRLTLADGRLRHALVDAADEVGAAVAAYLWMKWRQTWRQGGAEALRSKGPHGRARLDEAQFARLEAELNRGPAAHGWSRTSGGRWSGSPK
ncbi:hypothetical protein [Actinomadura nitritigenes]|uniref:hypothetical protein n=1 Tax=Actinomadura nitritigenes TaxID=134602 RepID=UPI003D8F0B16